MDNYLDRIVAFIVGISLLVEGHMSSKSQATGGCISFFRLPPTCGHDAELMITYLLPLSWVCAVVCFWYSFGLSIPFSSKRLKKERAKK